MQLLYSLSRANIEQTNIIQVRLQTVTVNTLLKWE